MDPQRQHAQLLGLWAQGNKLFRRMEYAGARDLKPVERWWNLARKCHERGFLVQLLPMVPPVLMMALPDNTDAWCTVADDGQKERSSSFRRVIWLRWHPPALRWDRGGLSVSAEALARVGTRLYPAILTMAGRTPPHEQDGDGLTVDAVEAALTLWAALLAEPRRMQSAEPRDWPILSELWRHRGTLQPVSSNRPLAYAWLVREGGRMLWPDQDEDSVHLRLPDLE